MRGKGAMGRRSWSWSSEKPSGRGGEGERGGSRQFSPTRPLPHSPSRDLGAERNLHAMSDLDITDSVLAELRSAADIVEVIGEHTKLKKAGRSWKGLCPFHNERTPSFTVDRDKGLYHCFGCGAGGDVIHFVRQIDRLDFPEAVEFLAQRFGITIPQRSRGPRDERREKLFDALSAA